MTDERIAQLEVPVEYGGVSIGDATARLGCKIDRSSLTLDTADETFVGRRLDVAVSLGQRDDLAGQGKMWDSDLTVRGVADCKRLGVTPDVFSCGLTFSLAEISIEDLAKFSKGAGRLAIYHVDDLPDDSDENETLSSTPPGTLQASGPWADHPLDALFEGAILKALKKAGLNTVGALADYTASDRRLTDLDGIGEAKAQLIEDRLMDFWRDNPGADGEPVLEGIGTE